MNLLRIFFVFLCFLIIVFPVQATPTQYIVLNFSEMNKLDWATNEQDWITTVKPKVLSQLIRLRELPTGTNERKLAWSTLMEFMNIPFDTPSSSSAYAIKLIRILDLAEELSLPVFIPFNTFQWWDELPELYNWWDPDGTHTPEIFFARQQSPDFRERFIKGYNPDNKWNVDWQNYSTPMKLNYRNWGSGGFRLAPPPNIAAHTRTSLTYRTVLDRRMAILLTILQNRLSRWHSLGKQLFVGMSIGTEISLNASVTPADEFMPYGYRAIQDTLCPKQEPTCGSDTRFSNKEIVTARNTILTEFLTHYAYKAVQTGIPKDTIYTHVWGDTTPEEKKYAPYALAAFNLYSNPGLSLYGSAHKPLDLPILQKMHHTYRYPTWGALEYNLPLEYETWKQGLTNTLSNEETSASIVVVYNWDQIHDTQAIPAIRQVLESQTKNSDGCEVPHLFPDTPNRAVDPSHLEWTTQSPEQTASSSSIILHMQRGATASLSKTDVAAIYLSPTTQQWELDQTNNHGIRTWFLEMQGCTDEKSYFSEPRIVIQTVKNVPSNPWWIHIFQNYFLW